MSALFNALPLLAIISSLMAYFFWRKKTELTPRLSLKLAELVQTSQHDGILAAHHDLGDVFRLPGKDSVFYFRNADVVGRICTDSAFVKNDAVYGVVDGVVNVSNLVQPLLHNTLFQKDGPEWKQARKDINPLFASPDFAVVALQYTDRYLETLGDSVELCDLQEEMHIVLQQATMRLMAGVDLTEAAATAYAEAIKYFAHKDMKDLSQADAAVLLKVFPHAMSTVAQVKALGPTSSPGISRSLVGLMLKAGRYSDEEIARTLVNLVVAGAESPAAGIAKTIAGAAASPKVMNKINEELEQVIGTRRVTPDCLGKLRYLENVVKEGLRRYDPATIITRRAKADIELEGVHVPAGSLVAVCVHAVHMDERLWDQPERFAPERFESGDTHPYAWLPFGGGVRGCPGKRPSLTLGKAILSSLFLKYDVALKVPIEEMDSHSAKFTSWARDGVPVSLHFRNAR